MISESIKQYFTTGSEGASQRYGGGVLPSVLLLLLLFSLVFTYELRTYKQEAQLYQQTQDYYQAKTLERLTVGHLLQIKEVQIEGTDYYNIGKVSYRGDETKIALVISLETGFRYETTVERTK